MASIAAGARTRIKTLGEIVGFAGTGVVQIPQSTRYMREVWWYAAFLAIGSTPIALVLTYFTGSEGSVEAYYSLSQIGAQSLAGGVKALREHPSSTPPLFRLVLRGQGGRRG